MQGIKSYHLRVVREGDSALCFCMQWVHSVEKNISVIGATELRDR